MKILSGDTVKVIAGDDKNKIGRVLKAFPRKRKIVVENVNLKFEHKRRSAEYRRGAILQVPHPIYVSNVMLLCPNCAKPTKINYTITESKEKIRQCKKCKQLIPYPTKK